MVGLHHQLSGHEFEQTLGDSEGEGSLMENPKDSIRKLLEVINEYSKVAGYKINTQKFLAFLCTNNEKTEREIKKTIPLTSAMKRIKDLGINLPKETKDLYMLLLSRFSRVRLCATP